MGPCVRRDDIIIGRRAGLQPSNCCLYHLMIQTIDDWRFAHGEETTPLHPGEVLREEFLVPLKMSAGALAKACGVPRTRIERLASEQIGITADTALRLSKALGRRPNFG
jgi:addiction module HigA family antidote